MSKITLGTIFIGRTYCLDDYLDFIKNLDYDPKLVSLLWVIRGGSQDYIDELNDFAKSFQESKVIHLPHKTIDHDKRTRENDFMRRRFIAQSYDILFEEAKKLGNDLFVVEDDVIPPKNALKRLLALQRDNTRIAYSGLIRSTFDKSYDWYPIYHVVNSSLRIKTITDNELHDVQATTWGCILFDKELWKYDYIPSQWMGGAHDQGFGRFLRTIDKKILCDFSLKCCHYSLTSNGNVLVLKEHAGKWFERWRTLK